MRKLKLDELERISVNKFHQMPKRPISIVLDNLRSGLNVGSVFRTADAFAVEHLFLCGITAQPPHREILKSAIGATQSVSWSSYHSVRDCITHLRTEGWTIVGVEQTTSSIPLQTFSLEDRKVALIFGNEVDGISQEILELLDLAIEIPQWGTKHSLNVSVCAGIVLWHLIQNMDQL